MNSKYLFKFLILTIVSYFVNGIVSADTLDHRIFLQEINNSHDRVYNDCLEKYNTYLANNPKDLEVHIEKCKFILYAQYDENEGYNPNQEAFDSCVSALIKQFPSYPEIFLFQITYLWGDELTKVFNEAEIAIENNPEEWSDIQLGILYKSMSYHYSSESDFPQALIYIEKAISKDTFYKTSLEYARILIELDRHPEALNVLQAGKDTTKIPWELSSKADLYLELEDYESALDLYNLIDEIDSTYNNNVKIANTLEGVGEFMPARKYLVADTATNWNKEASVRQLLIHDLKYQSGAQSLATYNAYRDYGYMTDPLGIFRLTLFISHPLQPWKFRDILSLISLHGTLLLLIIIPFLWILPIYFIGHHLNLISRQKAYELNWGLKAFWFVSAGYLIAAFASHCIEPEYLYSLFLSSYYAIELSQEKEGLISILFVLLFAIVGLATLYKVNPRVLLRDQWTVNKSILNGFGILAVYKFMVGIYIWVLISTFGITMEDLTGMLSHFLATRQEIEAIIAVSGGGIGFILICLLVPVYEEIIFRGVILDASQRYLNFNLANWVQAVLFATIHANLYMFPVFLLFGLITGVMRKKSGGLLAGIIFHVINNILAFSILLIR